MIRILRPLAGLIAPPAYLLLGLLVLVALPTSAHAAQPSANPLDWSAFWSWTRLILTAVLILVSFLVAFGVAFPAWLNPARDIDSAPWPRTAFARSLALAVFLSVCSFLLFFAVLEDELIFKPDRGQVPLRWAPNSIAWANIHIRWILVLILGAGVSVAIWQLMGHRSHPGRKTGT